MGLLVNIGILLDIDYVLFCDVILLDVYQFSLDKNLPLLVELDKNLNHFGKFRIHL